MFDDICKRILSPPKFKYSAYDLGSTISKHGKRTDFLVYNKRGFRMNCSLYQPHVIKHDRTCIIYLHSMNGSRLQGLIYSQLLLQQGTYYCTFDFSACGNSDGDKISFGANQKYDVQLVIKKLKQTFYLNRFILWGRSMGAVAAVKYAELSVERKGMYNCNKGEIVALVLDSAFKSLSQLLVEIGHVQTDIPKFLIKAGYYLIKNTLEQNGNFNIQQLDLINPNIQTQQQQKDIIPSSSSSSPTPWPLLKLQSLQLPILFLTSKQDKTVSCQHSIDMFNAYDCTMKELAYFRGRHNESREEDYLERVMGFVGRVLMGQNGNNNRQGMKRSGQDKEERGFGVQPVIITNSRRHSMNLFLNDIDHPTRHHHYHPSSNRSSSTTTRNLHSPLITPNNNNTQIPDPISLPLTPRKPTLLELIQSNLFKSSHTDGSQTIIEAESIQETCMCAMTLENKLGFERQSPRIMAMSDNSNSSSKQYAMSKANEHIEGKPNFNCDRISLKSHTPRNN